MKLTNFDHARFLAEDWQRRPRLIRNGWDGWENPLEPEELAGLACEPGVESRLVELRAEGRRLEHGPFAETRFGALGEAAWTLLVQAVDHHVPAVADLLETFAFIPNWRVDDVMVSYASEGAGVGAHYDNYDVFLVQGLGRRRWRVGGPCDEKTPLLPHPELRLLAEFDALEEYVLEPGDMLYLPPGIAHDGIALDDACMTYSIGFRAPSVADIVEGWSEAVLEGLGEDERYGDPGLALQDNPGEIAPPAIAALHRLALDRLGDPAAFAQWFGRQSTAPRSEAIDWAPESTPAREEVLAKLANGALLLRNPAGRFAFVRQGEGALTLFAGGEAFDCEGDSVDFAQRLCASSATALDTRPGEAALDLIMTLLARGMVALDEDE